MADLLQLAGVMAAVMGIPMLAIFAVPPIAKAFARRIEGAARPGDEVLAELDALRDEVAALRELAPRLLELEERVDFTERLIARQAEPGVLMPARPEDSSG